MDESSDVARMRRLLPSAEAIDQIREKLSVYDKLSRQLENQQEYGGSPENIDLTLTILSAIIDDIDRICCENRISKPLRYNGIVVVRKPSKRPTIIVRDDDCIDLSREIRVFKTPQIDVEQEIPF